MFGTNALLICSTWSISCNMSHIVTWFLFFSGLILTHGHHMQITISDQPSFVTFFDNPTASGCDSIMTVQVQSQTSIPLTFVCQDVSINQTGYEIQANTRDLGCWISSPVVQQVIFDYQTVPDNCAFGCGPHPGCPKAIAAVLGIIFGSFGGLVLLGFVAFRFIEWQERRRGEALDKWLQPHYQSFEPSAAPPGQPLLDSQV